MKSTWKCVERHSDSDIGQLLLYQLAVQAQVAKDVAKKRIQTKPTPLLGLFIGGLQVYIYIYIYIYIYYILDNFVLLHFM